jgi:hypothetical protein
MPDRHERAFQPSRLLLTMELRGECSCGTPSQDNRHAPPQALTPARIVFLKVTVKREGDQERNDEPTVMQTYFDPEYAAEFDLRLHLDAPVW